MKFKPKNIKKPMISLISLGYKSSLHFEHQMQLNLLLRWVKIEKEAQE